MTMVPGVYHTGCIRNTTYRETFTLSDASGAAVDLTGSTVTINILNGGTIIQSLSPGNGMLAITPTTGVIAATLGPAQTALLTGSLYTYELLVTSPAGIVDCWLAGNFTVSD